MFINEYGNRDDPTIVLLAPMMVSGSDLYDLMKPYFKGAYEFPLLAVRVLLARRFVKRSS